MMGELESSLTSECEALKKYEKYFVLKKVSGSVKYFCGVCSQFNSKSAFATSGVFYHQRSVLLRSMKQHIESKEHKNFSESKLHYERLFNATGIPSDFLRGKCTVNACLAAVLMGDNVLTHG